MPGKKSPMTRIKTTQEEIKEYRVLLVKPIFNHNLSRLVNRLYNPKHQNKKGLPLITPNFRN